MNSLQSNKIVSIFPHCFVNVDHSVYSAGLIHLSVMHIAVRLVLIFSRTGLLTLASLKSQKFL